MQRIRQTGMSAPTVLKNGTRAKEDTRRGFPSRPTARQGEDRTARRRGRGLALRQVEPSTRLEPPPRADGSEDEDRDTAEDRAACARRAEKTWRGKRSAAQPSGHMLCSGTFGFPFRITSLPALLTLTFLGIATIGTLWVAISAATRGAEQWAPWPPVRSARRGAAGDRRRDRFRVAGGHGDLWRDDPPRGRGRRESSRIGPTCSGWKAPAGFSTRPPRWAWPACQAPWRLPWPPRWEFPRSWCFSLAFSFYFRRSCFPRWRHLALQRRFARHWRTVTQPGELGDCSICWFP